MRCSGISGAQKFHPPGLARLLEPEVQTVGYDAVQQILAAGLDVALFLLAAFSLPTCLSWMCVPCTYLFLSGALRCHQEEVFYACTLSA
jgi:hypothetical protein